MKTEYESSATKTASMPIGIYALAISGFAMGTEGYVYVGHLNALADEMGTDLSKAGQIASAFAITYAFTAPLTAAIASRFDRRKVLMTGLLFIGALNILAAVSASFSVLIGVRIACGIAAGLVGPISSVAATELVPKERRGKALGIVMSGMTGAFVLGIPIGSALGEWFGWRGTFVYAGVIAFLAAVIDRLLLPTLPGRKPEKARAFKMILSGQALSMYALTLVGFASTFTTIAYIGPLVTAATGLTGSGVGMMQSLIGVGSILGIALGIRIADSRLALKVTALTFGLTAISMVTLCLIMIWLPMNASTSTITPGRFATLTLFGVSMIIGSAALFSRTPVIQTRLVSQSPQEVRTVVMALNGSMVFLGQGLGASIGGLSISMVGITWLGLTAGVVASAGMVFTLVLDRQERLSEKSVAALALKY